MAASVAGALPVAAGDAAAAQEAAAAGDTVGAEVKDGRGVPEAIALAPGDSEAEREADAMLEPVPLGRGVAENAGDADGEKGAVGAAGSLGAGVAEPGAEEGVGAGAVPVRAGEREGVRVAPPVALSVPCDTDGANEAVASPLLGDGGVLAVAAAGCEAVRCALEEGDAAAETLAGPLPAGRGVEGALGAAVPEPAPLRVGAWEGEGAALEDTLAEPVEEGGGASDGSDDCEGAA